MTTKDRDAMRELKAKEREERAFLNHVGWPVSFESFEVRHGELACGRRVSSLSLPPVVHSSERSFSALV